MSLAAEALRLYDLGLNVVPVKDGTKAPSVPWMTLQTKRADREDVERWFAQPQGLGLAAIMGEVSCGLVVLDFDQPEGYRRWREANSGLAAILPTAATGRGFHVLARCPDVRSGPLVLANESSPVGDVLADRKLCVLPPTRHPSGFMRKWLVPLGEMPAPVSALELGLGSPMQPRKGAEGLPTGGTVYVQGGRHQGLASLAARLRNSGLAPSVLLSSLLQANSAQCFPPLESREVEGIADWANSVSVHPPYRERRGDDGRMPPMLPPESAGLREDEDGDLERLFLPLPEYLQETPASQVDFIVEDLLAEGYLVILGGTSKAGKSCFLTSLGLHVAAGEPFMGLETQPGAVLWCALEESEGERRIALEGYDGPSPKDFYISHAKFCLDEPEDVERLRWWIRKTGAKLLIIDPLYAASKAESLGDGIAARRVLQPLKDLCREERACAVVVHHLTKNVHAGMTRERFADSNQLLAAASMDVLMDSTERADGSREIVLRSRGRGAFANQTWIVESTEVGDYRLLRHGPDAERGPESCNQAILEALRSAGPMTAQAIADAAGLKAKTAQNRLTDMQRQGMVLVEGKEGKANLYRAA